MKNEGILTRLTHSLTDLFHRSKKTDIAAHLICTLSESRERAEDHIVDLAGVRLAGDVLPFVEAHLCTDHLVELLDFLVITIKELYMDRCNIVKVFDRAWGVTTTVRSNAQQYILVHSHLRR